MSGTPPSLRSYTRTSVSDNSSPTLTFDVPPGTRDGNELLLFIVQRTTTVVGSPQISFAAWGATLDELNVEDGLGLLSLGATYRTAKQEPATYELTSCAVGAGVDLEVVCLCYLGADGIDRSNTLHHTSPQAFVAVGVTSTFSGDRYVAVSAVPGQGGAAVPPFDGQSSVLQIATPTISMTVSEEALVDPGTFVANTRTATLSVTTPSTSAGASIKSGPLVNQLAVAGSRLHRVGGGVQ